MSVSPPHATRTRATSSLVLALCYAALFVPLVLADDGAARWYGLGIVAAQLGCLLARWRLPRITLVVSLLAASVGLVAGWVTDPCLASACVLYAATVDAPAPSRHALWTAWVMLAGTVVMLFLVAFGLLGHELGPSREVLALLLAPTVLAASWALSCTLAARRRD